MNRPSRRTVVTGAHQPLGMAAVRLLLDRGDDVVAIVPRPERVPALTDLLQDVGPRLAVIAGDAGVGKGANELLARVGDFDALLHTAIRRQSFDGLIDVETADSLGGVEEGDFVTLVAANAWSTVAWVRGAVPLMARARDARILVVLPWLASLAGKTRGGDYAYCASLAARAMVVRSLAADLVRERVTVAAVNPGNYRADLEGPAFLHDVVAAASGLVDRLEQLAPADSGCWWEWNGTQREW